VTSSGPLLTTLSEAVSGWQRQIHLSFTELRIGFDNIVSPDFEPSAILPEAQTDLSVENHQEDRRRV